MTNVWTVTNLTSNILSIDMLTYQTNETKTVHLLTNSLISAYNNGTVNISPSPNAAGQAMTITTTVVTVTATNTLLIAANLNRKYLGFQVTGTNPCSVRPGATAATWGTDQVYSSGGTGPSQGGGNTFDAVVSTDAWQAICNTGLTTTVVVWEGN